ncbi:GTP pyrophosphokinase family protein [Rummeliibacillus sp. NPDC094406]|uniref:GTP pyrophosphokinase n=1 Tax=Rummeliibacillus sp. NPDC094406 TaxID=3364511 RepID=UPI0038152719
MLNDHKIDREQLKKFRHEVTRCMLLYKFALAEITTKVNILQEEFQLIHEYNPIEHVNTRVKSPESILKKVQKKKLPLSIPSIQENIHDISGIRIICSFVSDIYRIADMIQSQEDIEVIEVKDYIENPKPNGYQSLHIIIKIPVFMTYGEEYVFVEMQIRTIAMDFWASLEHKIYYKYNKKVPSHLTNELKEAAEVAANLDRKMEKLNNEVTLLKEADVDEETIENPSDTLNLLYNEIKKIELRYRQ